MEVTIRATPITPTHKHQQRQQGHVVSAHVNMVIKVLRRAA
jgi:hypothetical protein